MASRLFVELLGVLTCYNTPLMGTTLTGTPTAPRPPTLVLDFEPQTRDLDLALALDLDLDLDLRSALRREKPRSEPRTGKNGSGGRQRNSDGKVSC